MVLSFFFFNGFKGFYGCFWVAENLCRVLRHLFLRWQNPPLMAKPTVLEVFGNSSRGSRSFLFLLGSPVPLLSLQVECNFPSIAIHSGLQQDERIARRMGTFGVAILGSLGERSCYFLVILVICFFCLY